VDDGDEVVINNIKTMRLSQRKIWHSNDESSALIFNRRREQRRCTGMVSGRKGDDLFTKVGSKYKSK
jgi:hypothetical protein